ncbi:MAG: heat-inducible transcriptional repressor HrcA [Spirochaetia bacterium]|nr:heat-inducible transcriptional repressor HrcA [Spirochaetia bacterium]
MSDLVSVEPQPDHNMTLRQREILKLVVAGYVQTEQPISSAYITENFQIGLSSATVRSIFADLESQGYLYSPHRSAGRIPTEKGYRLFAQELPELVQLPDDERKLIQEEYLKREFQVHEILSATCKILSKLTDYAGVVLAPEPQKTVLKHIELIDLGQDEILIVLVTRSGTVFNKSMFVDDRIPPDVLHKISRYLNDVFKGCDLLEIRERLQTESENVNEIFQYFPLVARSIIQNFGAVSATDQIYTSGVERLIARVGAEREESLQVLGSLYESSNAIRGIFSRSTPMEDILITIDGDRDERLGGLSVVTASYKMGETRIGSLGVVGPNNMDYVRVVSIVEYIRRLLSSMITRMSS